MKKALILLLLVALALPLTACGRRTEKYSVTWYDLFDTVGTFTGYAPSEKEFLETADSVHEELLFYHRLFDIYHEYEGINNLCTVNENAGGDAVELSAVVLELLGLAGDFREETGGRTDITLGSVLRIWHEARERSIAVPEEAYVPDAALLSAAKAHSGPDLLEIDRANGTVRLTDPCASLDVGAFAKGFAVQKACEKLPEGYLLSLGGNVFATGPKPDGTSWHVGVQDPDGDSGAILCVLSLDRGAAVTSGDYQRAYTADGVSYHHIIDPETCMPARLWHQVTVLCDDSALADALSTALFLLSREEGEALLEKYGAEALWADADGAVFRTDGFEKTIIEQ